MKKIHKSLLITATLFSAAVNMNGCGAYGPPPDEAMYNLEPQVMEEQAVEHVVEEPDY